MTGAKQKNHLGKNQGRDSKNGLRSLFLNTDCRHFLDYKPCRMHKQHGVICEGCPYYDKVKSRILIINLEAMGDVLRTTAVLEPLKKKYPYSRITWLTTQKSIDILKNNPYVDRIMVMNFESCLELELQEFEVAINVEKAHEACALFTKIKAKEKFGFEIGRDGNINPLNKGAKYFMDIGVSDIHKRNSHKTQQEIVFDICEIPYNGERSILNLDNEAKNYADNKFVELGIRPNDIVVGFNTGCSTRLFLDRKWTIDGFVGLARLIHEKTNARIMLLGGPGEVERNREIASKCAKLGIPIIDSGTGNSFQQFAAIVGKCSMIVTGDTLAVHIAAALGVPAVVMFGNLMPHEIELYGKGKKILTDMECAGCYKYKCEFARTCMDRLKPEKVFAAFEEVAEKEGFVLC